MSKPLDTARRLILDTVRTLDTGIPSGARGRRDRMAREAVEAIDKLEAELGKQARATARAAAKRVAVN